MLLLAAALASLVSVVPPQLAPNRGARSPPRLLDDRIAESTRRRMQGALGELGGVVDVVNEIREGEWKVGQIPEGSDQEILAESTEFPPKENATALVIEPRSAVLTPCPQCCPWLSIATILLVES